MNEKEVEADFRGKNVLTSREAALYLGITQNYLYRLTSERKIPHSKPGGKMVYFSKEALDSWALRNHVASVDEINDNALTRSIREGRA